MRPVDAALLADVEIAMSATKRPTQIDTMQKPANPVKSMYLHGY